MAAPTRWLLAGIPILAIGGVVYSRIRAEKGAAAELEKEQQARRGNAPAVDAALAGPQTLDEVIQTVGTVEAPFNVVISPRVTGRITFLDVREGDSVTAGQVLVRIDPSEANAAALQQQAQVSEARARLAQAEATTSANNVSIESEIRVQRASLASAQENLRQQEQNYASIVAAAESRVTEAKAGHSAALAEVKQSQAEKRAAEARLRNAKANFNRVKALFEQGYRAGKDVEDAQTTVDTEQANVDLAEGQIESNEAAAQSALAQVNSVEKELAIAKQKGKADIAAAKAMVEQAKAALDEATANRSQSNAYNENIRALRAGVNAAEAGAKQAGVRVSDTQLAAPITGTVTKRSADPGSLASAGQTILEVQSLKWVYVTASLPIENAPQVRQGQDVEIRFDSLPGKVVKAKVADINRSADARSRQFTIRMRLENPGEVYRPGMFAQLRVIVSSIKAQVAVPITALQKGKEGDEVTVIDAEGKAVKRPVKTGRRSQDFVEIIEGLSPDDKVVTLSYSPVREGQKVSVSGEEEQASGEKE